MLKLTEIKKNYLSGENEVKALKGINIEFRESEFVSILGPSGCGKTTMLNIIGGLDRYTTGDLIINGKSTKEFKGKDWDAYRNHSIGFVFQNYNLIPHQTVLSNVELSLTLAGVSKKEKKQRAIEALEKVGLKDQIYKKPNQLSGGQMQRVAIARALVNNPDIILADEPTGALDTGTSVQVMEILKEISKDKLIIMVTHNPELAEKYSTRIVKILDGVIRDDSNPYKAEDEEEKAKIGKTSMSFFTALALSLSNLMTKKGRTFLTAFAGSIGIIGISLILALSNGVQNYIDKVEEDTLSSYPITIEKSTIDMSSMLQEIMGNSEEEKKANKENIVVSTNIMEDTLSLLSNKVEENNLIELKKYLDKGKNDITKNANDIQYNYNIDINIYNENSVDGVTKVNPSQIMNSIGMGNLVDAQNQMFMSSSVAVSNYDIFLEMLDNEELTKNQYNLAAGTWPKEYNEIVLMVNEDNEISDYTLYTLGLKSQEELAEKWEKMKKGEKLDTVEEKLEYTYNEILNMKFKLLLNTDYYSKENNLWIDKSDNDEYIKEKLQDAVELKIVGIIKPNKESVATTNNSGLMYYTSKLKEYIINKTNEATIVKEQKEKPEINILTGLEFPKEGEKSNFDYNSLSNEQKMAMAKLSAEEMTSLMETYTENQNATYESNLEKLSAFDLENPSSINIYPKDFESKDKISAAIEEYNKKQKVEGKEENVINYTDIVGVMMNSVTQIVNTISYVLIAFVAISLIVSSIMIGIITYISVLERIKEIGILRAIGASKRDITRIFNAETFIVGLFAGLIGIGVTVILTIPINSIIYNLSGVTVNAAVPFNAGVILVIISMLLTVIAGLIPAKIASKKDPVEALRTE